MAQQDGLVAERDARVGEASEGFADLGGQFARMVVVNAHEQRMIFLELGAQGRGDALRQEDGDAGADAQKLDVRNGAKAAEQMIELVVAEQQGVAAAQEDVRMFGLRRM